MKYIKGVSLGLIIWSLFGCNTIHEIKVAKLSSQIAFSGFEFDRRDCELAFQRSDGRAFVDLTNRSIPGFFMRFTVDEFCNRFTPIMKAKDFYKFAVIHWPNLVHSAKVDIKPRWYKLNNNAFWLAEATKHNSTVNYQGYLKIENRWLCVWIHTSSSDKGKEFYRICSLILETCKKASDSQSVQSQEYKFTDNISISVPVDDTFIALEGVGKNGVFGGYQVGDIYNDHFFNLSSLDPAKYPAKKRNKCKLFYHWRGLVIQYKYFLFRKDSKLSIAGYFSYKGKLYGVIIYSFNPLNRKTLNFDHLCKSLVFK